MYRWRPRLVMLMCHGSRDAVVPVMTGLAAYKTLASLGTHLGRIRQRGVVPFCCGLRFLGDTCLGQWDTCRGRQGRVWRGALCFMSVWAWAACCAAVAARARGPVTDASLCSR